MKQLEFDFRVPEYEVALPTSKGKKWFPCEILDGWVANQTRVTIRLLSVFCYQWDPQTTYSVYRSNIRRIKND